MFKDDLWVAASELDHGWIVISRWNGCVFCHVQQLTFFSDFVVSLLELYYFRPTYQVTISLIQNPNFTNWATEHWLKIPTILLPTDMDKIPVIRNGKNWMGSLKHGIWNWMPLESWKTVPCTNYLGVVKSPFWGDQTTQMYGDFEGFPYNSAWSLGW